MSSSPNVTRRSFDVVAAAASAAGPPQPSLPSSHPSSSSSGVGGGVGGGAAVDGRPSQQQQAAAPLVPRHPRSVVEAYRCGRGVECVGCEGRSSGWCRVWKVRRSSHFPNEARRCRRLIVLAPPQAKPVFRVTAARPPLFTPPSPLAPPPRQSLASASQPHVRELVMQLLRAEGVAADVASECGFGGMRLSLCRLPTPHFPTPRPPQACGTTRSSPWPRAPRPPCRLRSAAEAA